MIAKQLFSSINFANVDKKASMVAGFTVLYFMDLSLAIAVTHFLLTKQRANPSPAKVFVQSGGWMSFHSFRSFANRKQSDLKTRKGSFTK